MLVSLVSAVGSASVLKCEGREFDPHTGQCFEENRKNDINKEVLGFSYIVTGEDIGSNFRAIAHFLRHECISNRPMSKTQLLKITPMSFPQLQQPC